MANMRDLSFATINLLNLQVPGGITYDNDPHIPDTPEGHAEYQMRLVWLARQVREIEAEIIAFQELWSAQALTDVFAEANLLDQYDLVARDAPGRGRPQVALAVRKDRHGNSQLLPGAEWIPDFPADFGCGDPDSQFGRLPGRPCFGRVAIPISQCANLT